MTENIAIVTGGGGFLGKALCMRLLNEGFTVRAIQRGEYPELVTAGVQCFREDIANPSHAFSNIFEGVQVVFHVAAKVDMWGAYQDFYAANVQGSENVLAACKQAGVTQLVFTSSPSVVSSSSDLRGVDESEPYPTHYKAFYPQTKAMAEQRILAANSDTLYTCALRPHLIWGPNDTNLIPTILERAKADRLIQVGNGENTVDVTYIEDCVEAHVCAMRALNTSPAARGKAYFISQDEPVKLWAWINEVLAAHDMPPVKKRIPRSVAYALAFLFEKWASTSSTRTPLFTRFLVEEMSTDHYFDITRAKELLQYQPRYSMEQAMQQTFFA